MPRSTAGASCLLHLIVNQQRAGLGSRLPSCSLHSATLRCTDKLHVIPACETQPQQPSSMMKIASVGLHVTTPFYSSHSKNARSKAPILLSCVHKKATANTHAMILSEHRRTGHFLEGGWIDFARKIWGSVRKMNVRD